MRFRWQQIRNAARRSSAGRSCAARAAALRKLDSSVWSWQSRLLILLAVCCISLTADANDILRGGASGTTSRRNPADASSGAGAAAARQSEINARDRLSRTTQALQKVRAMQDAARKAAQNRKANNLGKNPNQQTLPVFNGLNSKLIQDQLVNVRNGLRKNGLKVHPKVPENLRKPEEDENPELWTGAELPVQKRTKDGTEVVIKQTESQAVLTWRTFNIGRKTTLRFDQSDGGDNITQWIAFNRVQDPSGAPSQILGSIKADGQVYVINQNGIIFGGTSQVNVHTLVATSLPINTGLVERGLLNNPDAQFLFSSIPIPAGTRGTPEFDPPQTLTPSGRIGDVEVREGAQIISPTSPEGIGGRIALIGANVSNAGTISTEDGQTILAAGLQVGIQAHNANDPSLRGIDVFVGAVQDPGDSGIPYAGTATNTGLIEAPRASVIITGRNVNQFGVVNSSTSVSFNGRVDLLANYGAISNIGFNPSSPTGGSAFLFLETGTVRLGRNSVTRIIPEYRSDEAVVGTELALRSQIYMVGEAIQLRQNAMVLAPNALVGIDAGNWEFVPSPTLPQSRFSSFGGIFRMEEDAFLDVAGTPDVFIPLSQSIIDVELRGAELADSPLQRDGFLRGETITVDVRRSGTFNGKAFVGTPLGDVTGFVGLIERNVAQLTVEGGTVEVTAGDSVVLESGSIIDASGGWMRHEGGIVRTTRLVYAGQIIDIADATPDRIYSGVLSSTFTNVAERYGIVETYRRPLFFDGAYLDPSYIAGANGGEIRLSAPAMALDGELAGRTVVGPRQLRDAQRQTVLPTPGSLELTFVSDDPREYVGLSSRPPISPTPPKIIFRDGATQRPPDPFSVDSGGKPSEFSREGRPLLVDPEDNPFIDFDHSSQISLREDRRRRIYLSPELLSADNFGSLTIDNRDGDIVVPRGSQIAGPVEGRLAVLAANVSIFGEISAPGGDLSFTVYNFSPYEATIRLSDNSSEDFILPEPSRDRGRFKLGQGALLSTAGLIVDDRLTAAGRRGTPLVLDGGEIAVEAFEARLARGSLVDVSAGLAADEDGEITYGDAGSISLLTGRDPNLEGLVGGPGLRIEGELRGFSGATGGSLELRAPQVRIGRGISGRRGLLVLRPEFFSEGGFGSFEIAGIGKNATFEIGEFGTYSLTDFARATDPENPEVYLPAVVIEPGTEINPVSTSLVAFATRDDPIRVRRQVDRLSDRTPVSLEFRGEGATDAFTQLIEVRGDVVMGRGASILTDPLATVVLRGDTVTVRGSITAPGGRIEIEGADSFPSLDLVPENPLVTVYISPDARLSTAGRSVRTFNAFGNRTGYVVPGGTIRIAGNIAAKSGAIFDVSGARTTVDVSPADVGMATFLRAFFEGDRLVAARSGLTAPLVNFLTVPVQLDSDAGSIVLEGGEFLYSDATLIGRRGGPTGLGGSVEVSSGRFYQDPNAIRFPTDINLVVTQTGFTIEPFREDANFSPRSLLLKEDRNVRVGNPIRNGNGLILDGVGNFVVDRFRRGGFDSLVLDGVVEFRDRVVIKADRELSVASGGVLYADDDVLLEAPYVRIGTPFIPPLEQDDERLTSVFNVQNLPFYFAPTKGSGRLTINASLIDIGNLSLQNIRRADFIAEGGDIRGNGTLNIAGRLRFRAAQIYPTTASRFQIFAYDFPGRGNHPLAGLIPEGQPSLPLPRPIITRPSQITFERSGVAAFPLVAGGTVEVYATAIEQGGSLIAPFGRITLGWDGEGSRPADPLSGATLPFPRTDRLVLQRGSLTSVAGIDPLTGEQILVPFGINRNETALINPQNLDITAGGLIAKAVQLEAGILATQRGSEIDIRGGGDLYFYRWLSGPGGSVDILGTAPGEFSTSIDYRAGDLVLFEGRTYSARVDTPNAPSIVVTSTGRSPQDAFVRPTPGINLFWTEVPESYAVIPGYERSYAPYAPFAPSSTTDLLAGDPGLISRDLQVGDRIFLTGSASLPGGEYTLLPRRYALLPDAVLVTPLESDGFDFPIQRPDGGSVVSGVRYNSLRVDRERPPLLSRFEVATQSVIRSRAEYQDYTANSFLPVRADDLNVEVLQRLPQDSGYLKFRGIDDLRLRGDVSAAATRFGRGAKIDISTPLNILITGRGIREETANLPPDLFGVGTFGKPETATVRLRTELLNQWGAESLLIGGLREEGANGFRVRVDTGTITVENPGTSLQGPDIILVANRNIGVAPGSAIEQLGETTMPADRLLLSGDGVLLRVSDDFEADFLRRDVTDSSIPQLTIGRGATISGTSVVLDSTAGTDLARRAIVRGDAIALNSGRITIALRQPGEIAKTIGLVLEGPVLKGFQRAELLSLLSYSTLDIYGFGNFRSAGRLELHAAEIRGFNASGKKVAFSADEILLDNRSEVSGPGVSNSPLDGTLSFRADEIVLGEFDLAFRNYATILMRASQRLRLFGEGSLAIDGRLRAFTPVITAARSASRTITVGGDARILAPEDGRGIRGSSPGAQLTIEAEELRVTSDILLPSGLVTLRSRDGDVSVGGIVDVSGSAIEFFDVTRYTNAGRVVLDARGGSATLEEGSLVDVSADRASGDAGTLTILAPDGNFALNGELLGASGRNGTGGSFVLEVGRLPRLKRLDDFLNVAGFSELRSFRILEGDVFVNGTPMAKNYFVAADGGTIRVSGQIDASGREGGTISLRAAGSIVVATDAVLDVSARRFSSAGKGGAVFLEGGSQIDGVIDPAAVVSIEAGSTIDLRVAANRENSTERGRFTGSLHLRAPQLADQSDVQIDPIRGTILGASKVIVEGYRLYDLTSEGPDGGSLSNFLRTRILADGQAFAGIAGDPATPTYSAMVDRLLGSGSDLGNALIVIPGAEVIHRTGDLTLGSESSPASQDWDLATFRFGPRSVPGVLTLRAAGDIVLFNAISDGFVTSAYTAELLPFNPELPANTQSWSYRFTAGADLSAADFQVTQGLAQLTRVPASGGASPIEVGSLKLGKNAGIGVAIPFGINAQTRTTVPRIFQVIRTGSGDIDVNAGRDIQLLNIIATIYTAGTRLADPTLNGTFDVPFLNNQGANITLGAIQQQPGSIPQYSLAGGNVSLNAGRDILHLTRSTTGALVPDSGQQLPMNWLYRRGYIDPETGEFGGSRWNSPTRSDIASTTWWIDFTNFFQGIGALGGGDVRLIAGRDVSNVDAVVPTNARMPKGVPDPAGLVELGGGDLVVRAGNNIDGGIYYVERGTGTLIADNDITTNATRSPSLGNIVNQAPLAPETWLPTTLFVGKATFDVRARGDVLLGPAVNPFLLPGGLNNTYWYKTYFSTFSTDSGVSVRSLGGDVTFRQSTVLPQFGQPTPTPILQAFLNNISLLQFNRQTAAFYRPWLRLNENSVAAFSGVSALNAPTLRAISFSGDINLVGNLTLASSPTGTLDLVARGAVNALQPQGLTNIAGVQTVSFGSSQVNLSDADPAALPGIATPFAYQSLPNVGVTPQARVSGTTFLNFINEQFQESGSPNQALEQKRNLHAAELLHRDDAEPLRVYAQSGSISGLTLFSPKFARIFAGEDITDIAFYIQHVRPDDISVVGAGRDIIPYNENAPLRSQAQQPGNILNANEPSLAGDIQITGMGTLEVLAGRDLDLGTGGNNLDGTGVGITSIGNARNPNLPFEGASILVAAGIGQALGLAGSALDFEGFLDEFVTGIESSGDVEMDEVPDTTVPDPADLASLPAEQRNLLLLQSFFRVLRDTGREAGDPDSPNAGNYDQGFAAIDALFGGENYGGDIRTRARDIRTRSGGDITILAPGGELELASTELGATLAPPGIITETGGNISIFTNGDVDVGIGRIFTLRGGNQIIWSSTGDIAAGASAKTVQSAPPTRVILDPSSADVQTDLAGLATGGGIGVLATVEGVPPGDVDLIAPTGIVDAGDAGIRATGSVSIAAVAILNASNISAPASNVAPAPAAVTAAPPVAALTSAASTAGAATSSAEDVAESERQETVANETPSIFTVTVVGYGGGTTTSDDDDEEDEEDEEGEG